MCSGQRHDAANHSNACCLVETCDWHGPYMLEGPGWWGRIDGNNEPEGSGHCPKCGHGKYLKPSLRLDPFMHAAQLALDGGEALAN